MRATAYLSNSFPALAEPYVMEEIAALRRRGEVVVPCSARRPRPVSFELKTWARETLYLEPLRLRFVIRAIWLGLKRMSVLSGILRDAFSEPHHSLTRRSKAIVHTCLGAYLAVLLKDSKVDHIHVHHGYFSSWIAMTAARLGGITYSMTLHGSDLLLNKAFLETKLTHCQFCTTVSEFNRRHITNRFTQVDPQKVFVRRMGIDVKPSASQRGPVQPLIIRAAGRLHPVKNHSFLIEACARLKEKRHAFACFIAGEGSLLRPLSLLIEKRGLAHNVALLGHLSPRELDAYYAVCNVVALTSRSEGLPMVLMEAMARGKIVLAPGITGIPELVVHNVTGFLYDEGSLDSFIEQLGTICSLPAAALNRIRKSAHTMVKEKYDRKTNLNAFIDLLLQHTPSPEEITPHEDFVLQQI